MTADRDPGRPTGNRKGRRAEARTVLLAAFLSSGFGACPTDRPAAGVVSDSIYVDLMARLSLIERELSREPERADSARRATLERRGVSPEELRRYARRHGDDPEHMLAIWRAIETKMGTLQETLERQEEGLVAPPEPPDDADPDLEDGTGLEEGAREERTTELRNESAHPRRDDPS